MDSTPPHLRRPREDVDVDRWSWLPPDILLEIFRRLAATDLVRCAGACKPWRRAIIGNAASCLRPQPDRFLPDLLIGFFEQRKHGVRFLRTPGPFQSLLAARSAAADDTACRETVCSFVPATAGGGVNLASYNKLLSSRDGLLLLRGSAVDDLCLCNAMTGGCEFLPAAAFPAHMYALVTGHDLSPSDDDLATRILAVEFKDTSVTAYQVFSCTSGAGAWGAVKSSTSAELKDALRVFNFLDKIRVFNFCGTEVVCGGAVHWIAYCTHQWCVDPCVVSMSIDVKTGRTRTTELPEQCQQLGLLDAMHSVFLTTSGDGLLSVVMAVIGEVQVWVLTGGDRWTLRRTIDMQSQLGLFPDSAFMSVRLSAFCPRSGYLVGNVPGQKIVLIDIERGTLRQIRCLASWREYHPYEMDWSTYISKMKHF
ncbi:hypothetical protein ACP70R_008120 [Stipagrostis hirtigluma subsp. patula]